MAVRRLVLAVLLPGAMLASAAAPRNGEVRAGTAHGDAAPVDNPAIDESCGVDLTLVLDASGSDGSADAVGDVREAAHEFLRTLADTDSTARVTQFAAVAEELAPSTGITTRSIRPGGALGRALRDYAAPRPERAEGVTLHRYEGRGDPRREDNWTERNGDVHHRNWDAALDHAAEDSDDELVVFVTLGEPTAYDLDRPEDPFGVDEPPDVGTRTDRDQADDVMVDRSIEAANAIKDNGTMVLAVGVGESTRRAALRERLTLVSGPRLVTDVDSLADLDGLDAAAVRDPEDLTDVLRTVVRALCSSSLTITSLAQTSASSAYAPAPDWRLTVEPAAEPPAKGIDWILPATAARASPGIAATSTTTETLRTNANGSASFQWRPSPETADSTVTVTQSPTGRPGDAPGRPGAVDYRCERRGPFGATRVEEGELGRARADARRFELDAIGDEIVACVIWNSFEYRSGISLATSHDPPSVRGDLTPPAEVTSTYRVTNPGNSALAKISVGDDGCRPAAVESGRFNVGDTNRNLLLDGFATNRETWEFRCTRRITTTSNAPNGSTIATHARAIGVDPAGTRVTDEVDDQVVGWNPQLSLTTLVNGERATSVQSGAAVIHTYAATNTGTTPLTDISLVDDTPGCGNPTFDRSSDMGSDGILSPDPDGSVGPGRAETWLYECTTPAVTGALLGTSRVKGRPLDPSQGTPFAAPNPVVRDLDIAPVDLLSADIDLDTSVVPRLITLGTSGTAEPVAYTYAATNLGDEFLARPGADSGGSGTTEHGWVVDDVCGPVTYVGGDDGDGLLAPNGAETWQFTCSTSVDETTINHASITGQPTDHDGTPLPVEPVTHSANAIVEVVDPAVAPTEVGASEPVPRGNDPRQRPKAAAQVADPGAIVIRKQTEPDGSDQRFDVVLRDLDGFTDDADIADGESVTFDSLLPGEYTVREKTPEGWALLDLACDDPTRDSRVRARRAAADIDLAEGETVRCIYRNVKVPAIVIDKLADPATTDDGFDFTVSDGDDVELDFELVTGGERVIPDLATGIYSVAEDVPVDWRLTGIDCDDQDTSIDLTNGAATVRLGVDELVRCTYTNTQRGSITITKQAVPSTSSQQFVFTVGSETVQLGSAESLTRSDLPPGEYVVRETVPGGWSLTSITCTDPSGNSTTDRSRATATITLDGIEEVRCTFTNAQGQLSSTGADGVQRALTIGTLLLTAGLAMWLASRRRARFASATAGAGAAVRLHRR